jgi:hypothetical protein
MCTQGLIFCPHDNCHRPIDPTRLVPATEFKAVMDAWAKNLRFLNISEAENGAHHYQHKPAQDVDGDSDSNVPAEVQACWLDAPLTVPAGALQLPRQQDSQGKRNGTTKRPTQAQADAAKAPVDPRKYKTRLCRNWVQTGECSYEHTCCFAHGESELRDAAANLKILNSLGYFLPDGEAPKKAAERGESNGKGGSNKTKGSSQGKGKGHGSRGREGGNELPQQNDDQTVRTIALTAQQVSLLAMNGIDIQGLPGLQLMPTNNERQ